MMKSLLLSAALLVGLAPAWAAPDDCKPSPLGKRELFLRGTMNGWAANDEQMFRYVCNHYELVTKLEGAHSYKIGDEDWSMDADFGGKPERILLKGPALEGRFQGIQRFVLSLATAVPTLTITAAGAADLASAEAVAPITDPKLISVHFDSRSLQDKSPFGAVTEGSEVRFALQAPAASKATLVIERRKLEGNQEVLEYSPIARLPMSKSAGGWHATHRFSSKAIYGYWFELEINGKAYIYQNNKDRIYWTREKGSMGLGLIDEAPESTKRIRRFRQTVYAADFKVPDWARDAVYYYIFPERFRNGDKANDPKPGVARYHEATVELHKNWLDKPWKPGDGSDAHYNNDFFGGDLQGIIEKLDYIKSVGANTIYMTPVFKASSNHKYDTADYKQIDPGFGTNADFERLCTEAAKRGIRVIPDASLNHVGQDSPYFNRFMNYPTGGAFDGGKINAASPYASWFMFDASKSKPDEQYKGWVGVSDLPELDKNSPSWRAFAYGAKDSVTRFWLGKGAAGWRMDVAPWVPDDFWREWRTVVKATNPDAITIAETWFDSSKFFLGDEFDSTMNYIFRNALLDYAAGGDAKKLYANIELMREMYPPQAFYALMNLLSTHDQARALHHFGYHEEGNSEKLKEAKQRLRLAVLFQMSFPGAPTIYYGDEVGLAGGDDPFNRAAYPWADEGGKPDEALLADFKRMTKMRADNAVLRHGSIDAPVYIDEHVIVLLRRDGSNWALIAVNNDSHAREVRVQLPASLQKATLRNALDAGQTLAANGGQVLLKLPASFGAVWLATEPKP